MNDKNNVIPVDFRKKKRVNDIDTSKLGQATQFQTPLEVIYNEKVAENAKKRADLAKKTARNLIVFGALLGIVLCRFYVDLIGVLN